MRTTLRVERGARLFASRKDAAAPSAGLGRGFRQRAGAAQTGRLEQLPVPPEFHHALAAVLWTLENVPHPGDNQLVGKVGVRARAVNVVGAQPYAGGFVAVGKFHPQRPIGIGYRSSRLVQPAEEFLLGAVRNQCPIYSSARALFTRRFLGDISE